MSNTPKRKLQFDKSINQIDLNLKLNMSNMVQYLFSDIEKLIRYLQLIGK